MLEKCDWMEETFVLVLNGQECYNVTSRSLAGPDNKNIHYLHIGLVILKPIT